MVNSHGPCPQVARNILSIKVSNAFEEQSVDLYFLKHLKYRIERFVTEGDSFKFTYTNDKDLS